MQLSEFVLTHVKGSNALDLEYFAEVSVTTRKFFVKKTERKKIHRNFAGFWHFVDDGTFTPGNQVESLERAYKAQEALRSL